MRLREIKKNVATFKELIMNFETILFEKKNKTAIITINRPDVYNALNRQGKIDIVEAIKVANADQSIRSIILTASGKAFCSGQDLNDRTVDARLGPVDIGQTLETEWNPLVNAIRTSEKLIIAAINGVAAGAGLSVVLACDLKISFPKIRFISGFTQIGLAPDAGLSFQLVRSMGYSQALAFALSGKPMLSEEMLERGFINEISDAPLESALKLSEVINQLAPLSVKHVKKNFQLATESKWNEVLEEEKTAQRFLGFSSDYKEGVTAFLEKRAPKFQGN
jgi:2-(1,2-epoxy-1,2-dihydrophenyl)acetyl-CoA isomerase